MEGVSGPDSFDLEPLRMALTRLEEAIALEVVACIPAFIEEVRVLRDRLGVREAKW